MMHTYRLNEWEFHYLKGSKHTLTHTNTIYLYLEPYM